MAVDKKSDFVGNHGGAYTDNDGMRKQFTYIDHDPKTKISGSVTTEKEQEAIKDSLNSYRDELIQRILDVPASLCPSVFVQFTVRGDSQSVVTWNETMLKDEGMSISTLRDIATLSENRFSSPTL